MQLIRRFNIVMLSTLACLPAAQATEIEVRLFGQNCFMAGPQSAKILEAVHAISPERNPSPDSAREAQELLSALKKATGFPKELQPYFDRMKRFQEHMKIFHEATSSGAKKKSFEVFYAGIRPSLAGKSVKEMEALTAKAKPEDLTKVVLNEQLATVFRTLTEPYPEAEFHRIIQKLSIRYQCSFENDDSDEDVDEAPEQPAETNSLQN